MSLPPAEGWTAALPARWDVVVVGGGPAGCVAAWAAAAGGAAVLLVEQGRIGRDRVCGEFLSAEAHELLKALIPGRFAQAASIETAAFYPRQGRAATWRLAPPARGLSRLSLDAGLWEAALQRGVHGLERTRALAVRRTAEQWLVTLQGAQGGTQVAAKALIVAAGRWWSIRGLEAATRNSHWRRPRIGAAEVWVGVKARFRGLRQRSAVEIFTVPGGYCGLAPVENGWVNACCLLRRDLAGELNETRDFAGWQRQSLAHALLAARLGEGEQVTETVVTSPVTLTERRAAVHGALLAGDASGFVAPFTGDGLARAILSGQLAAACLEMPEPESSYCERLHWAVSQGLRWSRGLHWLAQAPGWLQSWATRTLGQPLVADWLMRQTRWRPPPPL